MYNTCHCNKKIQNNKITIHQTRGLFLHKVGSSRGFVNLKSKITDPELWFFCDFFFDFYIYQSKAIYKLRTIFAHNVGSTLGLVSAYSWSVSESKIEKVCCRKTSKWGLVHSQFMSVPKINDYVLVGILSIDIFNISDCGLGLPISICKVDYKYLEYFMS